MIRQRQLVISFAIGVLLMLAGSALVPALLAQEQANPTTTSAKAPAPDPSGPTTGSARDVAVKEIYGRLLSK